MRTSRSSMMGSSMMGRGRIVLAALLAGAAAALVALLIGAAPSRADLATDYPDVVFQDGFESGDLSAWSQSLGDGANSVLSGAAEAGNYGLRLANDPGQ